MYLLPKAIFELAALKAVELSPNASLELMNVSGNLKWQSAQFPCKTDPQNIFSFKQAYV